MHDFQTTYRGVVFDIDEDTVMTFREGFKAGVDAALLHSSREARLDENSSSQKVLSVMVYDNSPRDEDESPATDLRSVWHVSGDKVLYLNCYGEYCGSTCTPSEFQGEEFWFLGEVFITEDRFQVGQVIR